MRKMLLAVSLLLAAPVFAGSPAGVSGKMVLDKVEDGLRQYRRTRSPVARRKWLEKLVVTDDPRVGVALGEALEDGSRGYVIPAARIIVEHYLHEPIEGRSEGYLETKAAIWWFQNEADLRRRAKLLPE